MSEAASPTTSSPGNTSREAVQAKIKCITSPDSEPIEEVHTLVPGGSPVAINIPGTGTIKLSANFLSSEGDEGSEAGDVGQAAGACECEDRADREAAVVSNTLKQIVPLRKMLSRIRKKVEVLSTNISSAQSSQPPRVDCGAWYGTPSTTTTPQLPMSCGPPVGGQSCGRTKPLPAIIEDPPTHFQNAQSAPKAHENRHQEGPHGHPHSDHHGGTFDHSHAAHHQNSYAHPHSDHHKETYNQPHSPQSSSQFGHPRSEHHRGGYDHPHTTHHESPYGHPHSGHHGGNFDQNRGCSCGSPHSEHHRGGYDHPRPAQHENPYGHPHSEHHGGNFDQNRGNPHGHPHSEHHRGGYDHPHPAQHESPYGHPHSEHHGGSPFGHSYQHSESRHYQDAPSEDPRLAPPERLCQRPSSLIEGVLTTPYYPRGPYMAPPNDPLYSKQPPEINKPNCPPYVTPVDMDSCAKTPCAPCPFRSNDDAVSRLYDNRYTMKYGTGTDVNVRNDAPPCCVPQLMGRCEPCVTTGPRKDTCPPCEYRKEPTC